MRDGLHHCGLRGRGVGRHRHSGHGVHRGFRGRGGGGYLHAGHRLHRGFRGCGGGGHRHAGQRLRRRLGAAGRHRHARHRIAGHAHVGHGAQRALAAFRDRRAQARPQRQRAGRVAAAIHRLGKDRVRLVGLRLHDHVVALGRGDAEFLDRDRLDVLAIRLHERHLQARDANIEMRHRAGIDEAHADAFARLEEGGPVLPRRLAVEQVGVGETGHVGDVGRVHPHLCPQRAVGERRAPAVARGVAKDIAQSTPVEVVVRAELLHLRQHALRVLEGPVGQHHDAFAVVGERLGRGGVDDQRAVQARLLLVPRMAVVPVRAVLTQLKSIGEGLAGSNAGEADARDAVHILRDNEPVPMD